MITDSSINSKTEDEIDSNQDNNKKKMSKEIITVIVIVVLVLIVAVVIGVFYINKHKMEESSELINSIIIHSINIAILCG